MRKYQEQLLQEHFGEQPAGPTMMEREEMRKTKVQMKADMRGGFFS